MDKKLLHARHLCLDQAQGFIDAAERLEGGGWPHIVYHLSLLALEEVGKASMLGARMINHTHLDGGWIDRSLDSHRHKLQWAVWSPLVRIDPADFETARRFAENAHALRLASLYVDAKADPTAPPPSEQVRPEEAQQALSMARERLEYEREDGIPSGEIDDLTEWFLDTMADPDQSRLLLSEPFTRQFEAMGGDTRAWVGWAREEVARIDREDRQTLEVELARPAAPEGSAKPRWRANAVVYTPSHSLRPKVLGHWNDQLQSVQLLWTGKKDQFVLQLTVHDNEPLGSMAGRIVSLTKLVVACLNIGSIGYFWFERAGFERKMFKEIRDLELNRLIEIGRGESFWGDGRAVALTDEHIDHAIRCMMAFAPLPEAEAEPIFKPYFDGLALIAKSDIFYSFDQVARRAFTACLAGALRHYGGWSGKRDEFEASFHEGFKTFMPDHEHRRQTFRVLTPEGDTTETPLVNLRSAKQAADLYLMHTAGRTRRTILDREA
ncbi:AbiV family abortive infection protein [Shumkonia mesophila]|uniref:AbiV family abortive infection protein n=1 Tax=Shumkonia mesophila TaxID=2838854 RepID=UPI0029342CEE|nr:AbiV family abortive infection protein [Shumkonia mesophila]